MKLKRYLSAVSVLCLLFGMITIGVHFTAGAQAEKGVDYEIVKIDNRAVSPASDGALYEFKNPAPLPQIAHPKGVFLKIKVTGNTSPLDFLIVLGRDFNKPSMEEGAYEIGNAQVENRLFISTGGTVSKGYIPVNFEGYMFIAGDPANNADLFTDYIKRLAFYTVNWSSKGSWNNVNLEILNAGYYSDDSVYDVTQLTAIMTAADEHLDESYNEIACDYDTVKSENYSFVGESGTTVVKEYVPSVTSTTVDSPKGIFFKIETSSATSELELRAVIAGTGMLATTIGADSTTNKKVFVSESGTVTRGLMPINFKGYVFLPNNSGANTNLNMSQVKKIGISMKSTQNSSWLNVNVTIKKAGFYTATIPQGETQYIKLVSSIEQNISTTYDYQFLGKDKVNFSGSHYQVITHKDNISGTYVENPKGFFMKVDVSNPNSMLEFRGVYSGSVVFGENADVKVFPGHSAGVNKVFISEDGTVTRGIMPLNFKGYVFLPASASNANLNMTEVEKIGIIMDPYGPYTWDGVTASILYSGIYSTSIFTDGQYLKIAREMEENEPVAVADEIVSRNAVTVTGETNKTAIIKKVTYHLDIEPTGAFYKISASGAAGELNFAAETGGEESPYSFGQGNTKIFVAENGTVTRGLMPRNFNGYVFVPHDAAANTIIPAVKINALGIVTGDTGWNGVTLTITDAGFYSVSKVAGDNQYLELVERLKNNLPIGTNYELTSNATNNIGGADGQITYVRGLVDKPTINNPKGLFFKVSIQNNTDVLDFTITMGKELSTQPNTDPANYLDFSNPSYRICVWDDGTVVRGYIPVNFSGYIFVPVSPLDNGSLPIEKIANIGFWRHNWTGKGSWAGVTANCEKSGYYTVSQYAGSEQYRSLMEWVEEETKITGDATYAYEVINDYETKELRDQLRLTAGNGDLGGGFEGSQALSGKGSTVVFMNNKDWSLDHLVYPARKPTIQNPKGIFFRFKTDAVKGSDFMVSLGEFAPGYEIGNGAPRKIFVTLDGTVYQNSCIPVDNFDGYVFIPQDADLNSNLKLYELYCIGVWFNHWQYGEAFSWYGKTTIFDNVGYYNVSRFSGTEQYAKMAAELNSAYGVNQTKDIYFTTETSPIPYDTLSGTQRLKPLVCVNIRDSIAEKDINWSVASGKADILPEPVTSSKKQYAFVKFNSSGKVIIRASLKSNSAVYADIEFNVAVDTFELEMLINEASEIENLYSDKDWAAFEKVLNEAEALIMMDNLTEAQVTDMMKRLKAAMDKILASSLKEDYVNQSNGSEPVFDGSKIYRELTLENVQKLISNTSGDVIRVKLTKPVIVTSEMLSELKKSGKTIRFEIYKNSEDIKLIWEFSKIDNTDMNLNLEINRIAPNIKDIVKLIQNNKRTQVISFKHSGTLPGKAKIIIENQKKLTSKDRLKLYYFDSAAGRLIADNTQVAVSNDGKYLAFTIEHCSDYLATGYKESAAPVPDEENSNILLIVIIVAGSLILIGGAVTTLLLILKRKKEKSHE